MHYALCIVYLYAILNYDNYENLKCTKGVYIYTTSYSYITKNVHMLFYKKENYFFPHQVRFFLLLFS